MTTIVPVILVPGVMSTQLLANGHDIWLNPLDILTKKVFKDLELNDDGVTPTVDDVTITPKTENHGLSGISNLLPLLKLPQAAVYEDMIKAMTEQGYFAGETLFGFPYDWRLDVRTASEQLHQYIQTVLQQTGAPQVQLVAHSMGGLVVKDLLLTQQGIAEQVSLVITLAAPYLGAPKTTKALAIGGDSMGLPLCSDQDMYLIEKNSPCVYQLSPSAVYDEVYGGTMCTVTKDGQTVDANHYYVNQALWAQAVERHNLWDPNNNGEIEQVHYVCQSFGKVNSTIIGVTAEITEGQPPMVQYLMGPGDGTVPHRSANHPGADTAKILYVKAKSHQEMLSEPSIIAEVIQRLQRQDVAESTFTEAELLAEAAAEPVGHAFVVGGEQSQFAHLKFVLTDKSTGVEQTMKFDGDGVMDSSRIPSELYTVGAVKGHVNVQFFFPTSDAYMLSVKGRQPAELHTYHYVTGAGQSSMAEVQVTTFTLDKSYTITA